MGRCPERPLAVVEASWREDHFLLRVDPTHDNVVLVNVEGEIPFKDLWSRVIHSNSFGLNSRAQRGGMDGARTLAPVVTQVQVLWAPGFTCVVLWR